MTRLLVLFFASGCAALIYETVWFYLVQLVVGASSFSVAVLLCAFMGGMALGSWLLPRVISSRLHPFRVVAALELGIGMLGLAIPLALPLVQKLYLWWPTHGVLLRAAVCVIILTPPTMLMGATLPAIARWRFGDRQAANVGMLYMANLIGATTGTVLAGFYLLRVYDTVVATNVAVALNIIVAAAFYLLAQRVTNTAISEPQQHHRAEPAPVAIYVVAALSGFTALGAEVVWTRQLSLLFGASVYTFSLILSVFLAGLGLGGLVGSRLARGVRDVRWTLGGVQALLALAIGFAAWTIVNVLPQWQPTASFLPHVHATASLAFLFDAARCAFALLPATMLWGASFPLAIAAGDGDFTRHVSRINAINTIGALAGAIALTLFGIPVLGSRGAQQALVVAAVISSLWLLRSRPRHTVVAIAVAMIAVLIVPAVPGKLIAYGRSVNSWDSIKEFLFLGEGATSSIAVTLGTAGAKQFHVAGKVEASDMDIDMRLERMLGHVPALLHPHPKSVLIVGVGAGVTAGALSIHPDIERIVICDIEPLVPISARAYFGDENHHVFDNPKVQLVFDDARHFMQTTDEKFDIITSDPIHPWVRGAATLYSLEYLELSKAHLTPGGVATQWIPMYETDEKSVKSEIATFASVFPDTTLWNPDMLEEGYDLVALGRAAESPIVEGEIQKRIDAAPGVKASLAAVNLRSAGDILSTYAGRGKDLAPWLADAEINRERNLRLQYLAGLAANSDNRFGIFQSILNYRRYPADLFVASADIEAQLRNWYDR
jgi:spermidine synthase